MGLIVPEKQSSPSLFPTVALISAVLILNCSCQIKYYAQSAYNQAKLLNSREPIDEALQRTDLSETDKERLRLTKTVKRFLNEKLGLTPTKSYETFVKLPGPYVTYVISAASENELKTYQWNYLFVGKMPYKGYSAEEDAKDEAASLRKEELLDTYVRGVSAYSTLGWFNDPVLSSMLSGSESGFVNTLIHESVHATLYVKNSADFNERLAVFVAGIGTERFYSESERKDPKVLEDIKNENNDEKIFADFIKTELVSLGDWYKSKKFKPYAQGPLRDEFLAQRKIRLKELQERFDREALPKMQSKHYQKFKSIELNNARLLTYKTYIQDLSEFDRVYRICGSRISPFMETMKLLESSKEPEEELKKIQVCNIPKV